MLVISAHGNSDRQLLDALSQTPFVDSAELAIILGEPHTTVHRILTGLLADGIVGRVSRIYYLTAKGIREAAGSLDFETPSDFVRACPMSKEWLTLLIRAWTRWPPSTVSPRHSPPASTASGRTWSFAVGSLRRHL